MAQLEDTYRQSRIQAGPEVEEFGRWLDECGLTHATPAQRRERILKLVDRYHDFTNEKAAVFRERRRLEKLARGRRWDPTQSSDDANDMDVDETDGTGDADDVEKWESESQTWGLLSRLLPLRHPDSSAKPSRSNPTPQSRREHWDEFILSDSVAKERKAVLEWLQSTACAGPDIDDIVQDFQQKADRGDLLAHNWLHTREAIKLHKSVNAIPHVLEPNSDMSDFSYVTQLDPDAMTRQNRKLEPHDEYFERAIWLGCYNLLRRGRTMKEIREWCLERTETWRAATISALPLSTLDDEGIPDFDPPSFILWRRMCYALVKSGGTDSWERATYGILSGDIDSVLSVCKTWDDYIFAHYNALLRTQFDSYLIRQCGPGVASTQFLPSFDAVQYLGDSPNVAKKLIEQIESDGSVVKQANQEANTAGKALQGAIIADTLDSYIYQQGLALSTEANQEGKSYLIPDYGYGSSEGNVSKYSKMSEHDGLRVVTHVVIMINSLDAVSQKAKDFMPGRRIVGEHAIAAYVSFLRLAQLELLIPLYCAQLSPSRQYETLSLNVIHVRDREEQLALLNQIRRVGMDIRTFLREQPQHFLKQLEDSESTAPAKDQFRILKHPQPQILDGRGIVPDFIGDDGRNEVIHENLIRSMEWLFAGEGNLLEACEFGVKIYKYFLKNKHLGAARDFFERVKVEDLIQVLANRDIGGSVEEFVEDLLTNEHALLGELQEEEVEDIRAIQTRLALVVKNMWELQCFVMALDGIETVGTLAQFAQESETSNPPNREYFENLGVAIRSAKTGMKPVLKGWLVETNTKDEEFTQLRNAYLPETIIAYVAALQYTGSTLTRDNMLEAMELAATIAGKDSDIAALFVKTGRMKELVEAFASCSKALAINSVDHKKGTHTSTKKMREMGWSKELWAVKPSP
ncbi:Nucleoporin NUP84 [Cytospora mali]|uniref:Nuclear pore complex protein n=1 Tax=Cytospora mali TaxID=578113 RepID=A0A194V979_CYTMA|nr:Nucleoporin NUP84 [Valsa mali var. pyri (nom. inval.)]